jgi:hypothetical protein
MRQSTSRSIVDRTNAERQRRYINKLKAVATADIIGKMLAACASGSLLDVRDRALLALSFA